VNELYRYQNAWYNNKKKTIKMIKKIIQENLETINIHKQRMPYIEGGWVKQIMGHNVLEVM